MNNDTRAASPALIITQRSGAGAKSRKMSQQTQQQQRGPQRMVTVKGVLPPNEEELDFTEVHSIIEAREDLIAAARPDNHAHVEVMHDDEIDRDVLDLAGRDTVVTFSTRSFLKQLVFYLKQTPHFFSIEVQVMDHTRQLKTLVVTNHKSNIRIDRDRCVLPVPLVRGWKYTRLDLSDLMEKAFGTRFVYSKQIRVQGGIRLYRVFFQDKQYSDAELPAWLRVLSVKPY